MQIVTYGEKASHSSCYFWLVLVPSSWWERKRLWRSLLSSLSRLSKVQSPFRHQPEKELTESPTRRLALVFSPVMCVPLQNSRGKWPGKEGRPWRSDCVVAF